MYKALKSFVGLVCMMKGEVKEISPEVAQDLLNCGYIEAVEETAPETKPKKKKTPKGA